MSTWRIHADLWFAWRGRNASLVPSEMPLLFCSSFSPSPWPGVPEKYDPGHIVRVFLGRSERIRVHVPLNSREVAFEIPPWLCFYEAAHWGSGQAQQPFGAAGKVEGKPPKCSCSVVTVFKWVGITGHIPIKRGTLCTGPPAHGTLLSHSARSEHPLRQREGQPGGTCPLRLQASLCLIRSSHRE